MYRKKEAYFTLEAAMVLPCVFGVIVAIIYLQFYQYNRCMLEMDAERLVLRGCSMQQLNPNQISGDPIDHFVAFSVEPMEIQWRGNGLTVRGNGILKYPFHPITPGIRENKWTVRVDYRGKKLKPVEFVRNCRKIAGGK